MSLVSGSTYILINGRSGTVADLSGDGQTIFGWGRHGEDNQRWELLQYSGTNQWIFRNIRTKTYLGIMEGHLQDGLQLRAVPTAVAWDINPDGLDPSNYRITVPGSQYNVDLTKNGDATNGTPIAIWSRWEGTNQTWRFERV
ncbi:hypothetical protein DXG01_005182 [Tephrocybe rancida]|nr:hypothetical protein DXG01_005182 [Tephrocybe rancida]